MSENSLREALEGLRERLTASFDKVIPDVETRVQIVGCILAVLAAYPVGVEPPAIPAQGRDNHGDRIITVEQVEKIHEIIENYSTDVVDYELATDDINAALWPNVAQPTPSLDRNWTVEAGALATNSLPEALREIERAVPTSTGESHDKPQDGQHDS